MLAFTCIFGPLDQARLGNFEHDHIASVKHAIRKTRQHEATQMQELHTAVNRMDAVRVVAGSERAFCTHDALNRRGRGHVPYLAKIDYCWPNQDLARCSAARAHEVAPTPPPGGLFCTPVRWTVGPHSLCFQAEETAAA